MSLFMPSARRVVRTPLVALFAAMLGIPAPGLAQDTPEPPELAIASVAGNTVTLSWAPAEGAEPEAYVVEGGFAPDHSAGSLLLDGDTTSVTLPLPRGDYYIRAYAVVEGQRSPASNEVQVAVEMPRAPSTPDAFSAIAIGQGVALSWRTTFAGGATERVILDVTGPVSGSLVLPNTNDFRVDAVPNGEYTLRLRAANDSGDSPRTPPVTVRLPGLGPVVRRNPPSSPAAPRLPVRFERLDTPRLDTLRARERLDAVVRDSASEFEAMVRVRNWTAAQFVESNPDPYPPWDALVVLDAIRAGITGGFCGQFSQVLLQSLASLGIPARYVEIGSIDNPYSHYVVEAWSNQFEKWIVLDATFVAHYELDGLPLSAREVHDALVGGRAGDVTVVSAPATGHRSPATFPDETKGLYYYVRYHLKADHLSNPHETAFDRYHDMIEFRDARTVPWELSPVPSQFPKEVLTARSVSDPAQVDAPINGLWVAPSIQGPATVALALQTSMPSVAFVEYRTVGDDGVPGAWRRSTSPRLVWAVAPGERAIEVRAVNLRGIAGPAAVVELTEP